MPEADSGEQVLVSVLMTAYNSECFISEAINSIIKQTYKYFELIVVDDCSNDKTYNIACEFAQKDKRIRIYKNDQNLGDYANRAKAASYAKGKYLKYLDSDNYLYPHGLSVLVSCMEKYPEAGLGLCKIHEASHPLPDVLAPKAAYETAFLKSGLFTNAPSSTIIRTATYHLVGGFNNTRHRGDYELWLKLSMIAPVVRIPGILDWDRIHSNQESNKNTLNKVAITYRLTINALTNVMCPLNEEDKKIALKRYTINFLINTFVKRLISRDFSLANLIFIYRSLGLGRKDFFRLLN